MFSPGAPVSTCVLSQGSPDLPFGGRAPLLTSLRVRRWGKEWGPGQEAGRGKRTSQVGVEENGSPFIRRGGAWPGPTCGKVWIKDRLLRSARPLTSN